MRERARSAPINPGWASTVSEEALLGRRLPLGGTFNVRDIGGYPTADGRETAWGRLLRGDALHRLDDEGRKLLVDFGLRSSLDLREPDECCAAPDDLPPGVEIRPIPFFSYVPPGERTIRPIDRRSVTSLEATYRLLVHERGAVLVAAIRALLLPGALPAIVHCTLGKDRTGVLVALLLAGLGVPDEVIAADFSATDIFLTEEFRLAAEQRNAAAGGNATRLAAILRSDPELISALLAEVSSRYGDVPHYLARQGFGDDELATLRHRLLAD